MKCLLIWSNLTSLTHQNTRCQISMHGFTEVCRSLFLHENSLFCSVRGASCKTLSFYCSKSGFMYVRERWVKILLLGEPNDVWRISTNLPRKVLVYFRDLSREVLQQYLMQFTKTVTYLLESCLQNNLTWLQKDKKKIVHWQLRYQNCIPASSHR